MNEFTQTCSRPTIGFNLCIHYRNPIVGDCGAPLFSPWPTVWWGAFINRQAFAALVRDEPSRCHSGRRFGPRRNSRRGGLR